MVVRIKVTSDVSGLTQVEEGLTRVPVLLNTAVKRQLRNSLKRFRRELKQLEPDTSPTLPFIWSFDPLAQARAHRWYFAAIAGRIPGVIIPSSGGRYRRTHEIINGWTLKFDQKKRQFIARNPVKGVERVMGSLQVPSHARTRWPDEAELERVLNNFAVLLSNDLVETWITITDKTSGIR